MSSHLFQIIKIVLNIQIRYILSDSIIFYQTSFLHCFFLLFHFEYHYWFTMFANFDTSQSNFNPEHHQIIKVDKTLTFLLD